MGWSVSREGEGGQGTNSAVADDLGVVGGVDDDGNAAAQARSFDGHVWYLRVCVE
jgi:hypothetical protein